MAPSTVALAGYVVLLIILLGFAAIVLLKILNGTIPLTGLIAEMEGDKASLSRFQFLIFTFLIAGLFLMLTIESGGFVDIPGNVLGLMGISGGSYVVSKAVGAQTAQKNAQTEAEVKKAEIAANVPPPLRMIAPRTFASAIIFTGLLSAAAALAQTDANDPQSCTDLWGAIGFPSIAEDADVDFVPVCHQGYVLAHNSRTKTPDWVIEHVTRAIAEGTETRPGVKFQQERNLPAASPGAVDKDYQGQGFDRGHQAPSADFKSSADLMADTFFLSNAVPQEGKGFNQTIWRKLEDLVRKLAIDRGELYVITGPVYQERRAVRVSADIDACGHAIDLEPLEEKTIGDSQVAVPAALYKIVYDPARGILNAYLLPNVDHRELQNKRRDLDYLETYRVGLDTVQQLTGWQFFTAFDEPTRNAISEECAATMLH